MTGPYVGQLPEASPPSDLDLEIESDILVDLPEDSDERPASLWKHAAIRFYHDKLAMAGLVVVSLAVITAIFAPWLEPQSPIVQHLNEINQNPTSAHWLGTDYVGRDVLSRLIESMRVSMEVCIGVVVFALVVALPLGIIAGYLGGIVDSIVMRVMDAMFTIPTLGLALAIAAVLGPSVFHTSVAIAVGFVPGMVRVVRGQTLAVRNEGYIEASRSVGITQTRMIRRHLLPNVAAPLIVQMAISFGYALLAEAGLSFLGLGVQPPNSSLGTMLQDAYNYILSSPWQLFPPGIALALIVLAFNFVGDGLRDALGRERFIIRREA
jgi:peptide/nickel transport system permease protein